MVSTETIEARIANCRYSIVILHWRNALGRLAQSPAVVSPLRGDWPGQTPEPLRRAGAGWSRPFILAFLAVWRERVGENRPTVGKSLP